MRNTLEEDTEPARGIAVQHEVWLSPDEVEQLVLWWLRGQGYVNPISVEHMEQAGIKVTYREAYDLSGKSGCTRASMFNSPNVTLGE